MPYSFPNPSTFPRLPRHMEHLPMAQGTFHIITFGCQMNVNDSFWLARSLQRRGFVESPLEKAEVVILNTCSVRDKPEQKV